MAIAINGSTNVITGVAVGGLPDAIVDADMLASNAVTAGKLASGVGGKILQVINSIKTDTQSTGASSNFVDITGLSVAITPTSSSNKILICCNITAGHSGTGNVFGFRLMRGSTAIAVGDADGNRRQWTFGEMTAYSNTNNTTRNVAGTFLDSPSTTSATTYKLQLYNKYNTVYINRSGEDSNSENHGRGVSAITVMEVAA